MRMIEVLNMMAEGEIKNGTKLIVIDGRDERNEFIYDDYNNGIFIDDDGVDLNVYYFLDYEFLNYEVELIPPKPKKYYLRLDKDDNCSYINKNVYFSYEVANKSEHNNYKTKFTQEEIDGSIFLKFIEQYGVKEEVEE